MVGQDIAESIIEIQDRVAKLEAVFDEVMAKLEAGSKVMKSINLDEEGFYDHDTIQKMQYELLHLADMVLVDRDNHCLCIIAIVENSGSVLIEIQKQNHHFVERTILRCIDSLINLTKSDFDLQAAVKLADDVRKMAKRIRSDYCEVYGL